MNKFWSVLLFMVTVNSFANDTFVINGKVNTEQGKSLAGVDVQVGDKKVTTNQKGTFVIHANISDSYQIVLSHPNYFSNVQTFSHFELSQSLDKEKNISDITLVKKAKNRVMLAFGGDVMMGRRFYKPYFGDEILIHPDNKAADSRAIVSHIKPYMSIADYAAVNLETQIADEKPTERAPKSVTFYSQPEILDALSWAGIDYVSLGNNHTYDYMDSGLHSTLKFLSQSQLAYSGAGINEKSALKAHEQKIKNNNFSMLGYVGWEGSANPTQTANNDHGGAAYGSMENMLSSVTKQVEKGNITIVQYHGSQEYANSPTGVTEQRLKSSLDAGAALAIAHHPHVTQGLELYDNKLIAYSMGNFIFDQNFSATQHSFILYVWLDGEKFHRAEIVPIYVKGYKPTPATGTNRYTVMKRLKTLSKIRNTEITQSGGHGVITANKVLDTVQPQDTSKTQLTFSANERVTSLYQLPWQAPITQIVLPNNKVSYRLGTNLINGSDFETFMLFDSPERGWLFDRESTSINDFGASGQHSLSIQLKPLQSNTFGMQSFKRVYKPSSPMTLKAKFNVQASVKINFYWQGRKTRQKLFDAFENGEKHLIGSIDLSENTEWKNVEIEFDSPRIGYKSYRVIAQAILENGEELTLNIDDFALIEWQTAYSKQVEPSNYNSQSAQASYLGIDRFIEQPITLKH
ncbi:MULTISPECIES: CapA family protein [unclassified Colwellia]|uniref:CapA family protein n=1 Tax=unclassified Colwellia TaxID=196834 RepID=UPI0015F63794|nr:MULTISPECIES: CapA family protein [unclassified Colwellia]MBA6352475.1 CapA family protein [Colwellia sp. BRX9-1]MBA6356804.1 CapA family protein [Colwellia sp. BRX8-3]MBA6360336.1 CapA family protein [Colwellia sp. BRX8-6]MBA6367541.1 CapA family protein [Colwellia sp. BRX8-5]MBA6371492.1 CapA family protein [Colwellia sp. BRX8-4]